MPKKVTAPPPSSIDLTRLQWHFGQMMLARKVREFPVVVHAAGRRWGKSTSRRLVMLDRMRRSLGFTEGCVGAHSHAESKNMWENDLRAFGPWIVDKANEDQRRFLEFIGLKDAESVADGFDSKGCRVWYPSLGDDHKTFQAHGLFWAIMDEMSLCGEGAWDDTIAPMLLDNDGHALLYGNAYPEGPNFAGFSDIWQRGNPKNHTPCGDPNCEGPHRDPRYISSSGCSWENPFGKIAVGAREAYEAMVARGQSAKARCLYMGEFCTDLGAVFTNLDTVFCIRNFKKMGDGLWLGRDAKPREPVIVSIDFGRHDDATVVKAFSRITLEMLGLMRLEDTAYLVQLPQIDAFIRRYPIRQIWSEGKEEAAAELLRLRFFDCVNFVKWSSGGPFDKATSVAKAMDFFQRGAVSMFDLEWMKEEFRLFERKKLPSGRWTYSAPEGHHDDSVAAFCYATYGLPSIPEVLPEFHPAKKRDTDEWIQRAMAEPVAPRKNVFNLRQGHIMRGPR